MTAISVGNTGSLVTRTIDQAKSKDLMLRELFQNALEATAKQTVGKKRIQIRITDPKWFGIKDYYSNKKFGIFNTGPGLSASKLRSATDLSSSIAKTQGIHANFGEGCKVACLPVNKTGMIWVSCHAGEVNMVILRKWAAPMTKEERYERQDFDMGDGTTTDVINITPLFADPEIILDVFGQTTNPSGLDTSEDWTYITLCGNQVNQDTTINPYGNKNLTTAWALNELYKRFAHIPSDVYVRSEIHSKSKTTKFTQFKTVFEVLKDKAVKVPNKVQIETVSIPGLGTSTDVDEHVQNGTINITYVWDGPYESNDKNADYPTSVISNAATCPLFSGIIYKNEIYDVRGGNVGTTTWTKPANECGIVWGYKYCRIYVHIPPTTDIVTDRYRTELLTNDHEKNKILFTDYKHFIAKHMPQWFIDRMKQFAPEPPNLDEVYTYLDGLLKQTANTASASKVATNTSGSSTSIKLNVNPTGNKGGGKGSTNTGTSLGAALIPSLTGKQKTIRPFPNIQVLTEKEIRSASVSQTFKYKAAEYSIDSNILFINSTYPAVDAIQQELLKTQFEPTDEVVQLSYDTSIGLITRLVGTGLVYGLAKQGKPGYEEDFEKTIDPACLSTHADGWLTGNFKEIQRKFDKDVIALEFNKQTAKAA